MIVEQMLNNAKTPLLHIADVSGSALFNADCMDILPLIPDKSVQLNFQSGTDLTITDFTAFDSIKVEVQTVDYPLQEVAVEVEALAIKGVIPTTVTENLFGNVLVFLTFTKGAEVWKNKVTTGLYIDKL